MSAFMLIHLEDDQRISQLKYTIGGVSLNIRLNITSSGTVPFVIAKKPESKSNERQQKFYNICDLSEILRLTVAR